MIIRTITFVAMCTKGVYHFNYYGDEKIDKKTRSIETKLLKLLNKKKYLYEVKDEVADE